MRRKMIYHGIAIIGIVIVVFLSVASGATTPAPRTTELDYVEVTFWELQQKVKEVNSWGQGFVVEAPFYEVSRDNSGQSLTNCKIQLKPTFEYIGNQGINTYILYLHNDKEIEINDYIKPYRFERYDDDQTWKRIESNKYYKVYVGVYPDPRQKDKDKIRWIPFIDRIEGLRSFEEVADIEAKEKAKFEAAQETQRQAQEKANKYDPSKFTVIPSDFRPADYTSIDLFKAVSASRNLQIVPNKQEAILGQMNSSLMFGMGDSYVLNYVSNLSFVRQNGTDITFSSDDNAITQSMTIDQRSGLQAGQRVRVYYMITRSPLTTWDVIAIERR